MANGQLYRTLRHLHGLFGARALQEESDCQLLRRFITRQDERAFAALVERHGPMVLAVCQRVLRDWHDAEDAFQATFLVLVRKASSLSKPELVGNWLYGVAYRTATKARAHAARRCALEKQRATPLANTAPEPTWPDMRAVVDEELSRLPEKYRAPLVLCYLEGRTNEEAARKLGRPLGSMSWLLARGRELLRERLVRRGLALATCPFALLVGQRAEASTPAGLADETVRAAVLFAAGRAAEAMRASTVRLAEEVLQALAGQRRQWAAWIAALLLIGLGGSTFAYGLLTTAQPPCKKYAAPAPAVQAPEPRADSAPHHTP